MICHRIGRPPISTIGLGLIVVSSEMRVPNPPARMTTFMIFLKEVGERNQSAVTFHVSSRRHNALLQQRRFRLDRGLANWQQPRLATLIDTAGYRPGGGLGAVLDQFASLLPSRLQGVCSHRTIDRELIL